MIMKAFLSLALILTTTILFGQIQIDKVPIEASKNEIKKRETGRNIQVVSKEEIELLPVQSVDELIRMLPGVEVQSRGGFGVQGDITLRGATFNQVMILIDGARIYDPLTGHFNSYIPVAIGEIEKIEIIKGAASAIYGPDALGGVINIITKLSSSSREESSAEVKAGSHGYIGNETAINQRLRSNLKYSLGVQFNQGPGEEFNNPNFPAISSAPEMYNTGFKTQTYSGGIKARTNGANPWEVMFRTSYDQRNFDAKYFYTASAFDESVENIKVWFNHLQISKSNQDNLGSKTTLDLTHRYGEDEFIFNPLFAKNFNRSQFYQGQLHHKKPINEKIILGLGLQGDYRLMNSIDRGDRSNYHGGAYAMLNSHFNRLSVNLSLRGDYDEGYEFELSPSLSLAYQLHNYNVRASASRGIRAGDFTERFVSTNLETLSPNRNLGNPDLEAESAWNYEVGVDLYPGDRLSLSMTGFMRDATDLIDYEATLGSDIQTENLTLDPESYYFYTQNIRGVETYGFESELRTDIPLPQGWVMQSMAGYTYLDSKSSEDEISKYVSNHAKHLVNGSLSFHRDFIKVFTSGLWKFRKTGFDDVLNLGVKKDYFTANAGMELGRNRTIVRFDVNNIGDVKTQDIYGSQLPGRWYIGTLKIKF